MQLPSNKHYYKGCKIKKKNNSKVSAKQKHFFFNCIVFYFKLFEKIVCYE